MINNFNYSLNKNFVFVLERLKDFKNLELEEQLSYSAIFIGITMFFLALIFWIFL
jgi:hypothetical protein